MYYCTYSTGFCSTERDFSLGTVQYSNRFLIGCNGNPVLYTGWIPLNSHCTVLCRMQSADVATQFQLVSDGAVEADGNGISPNPFRELCWAGVEVVAATPRCSTHLLTQQMQRRYTEFPVAFLPSARHPSLRRMTAATKLPHWITLSAATCPCQSPTRTTLAAATATAQWPCIGGNDGGDAKTSSQALPTAMR